VVYEVTTRALLVLMLWVPIAVLAFGATKPLKAALFVLLGGVVLLPERAAFDFPLLPPFDKNAIACAMAFFGATLLCRRKMATARPFRGPDVFFLLIVVGNVGTALTNGDPLTYGGGYDYDGVTRTATVDLPPITTYDILSMTVRDFLGVFMPFYIGRALFRTREDAIILCKGLVVAGLVYVPFMLLEMRLSPQLHYWAYGYYANFFGHAVRGAGFKPTVFMDNGLAVAMFILSACVAAAVLHRLRVGIMGIPAIVALGILWIALLLSRNVGANVYALAALPLVLTSRGALASRLAVVLFALVVAFPVLRSTDQFPAEALVDVAAKRSVERAQSLQYRFENEEVLLEKARERVWFGWGGFGRNRVFDERGKDVSVTDGEWIITLGSKGVVGFVGIFGLLLVPILIARRRAPKIAVQQDRQIVDALTLLVAMNAVDMLPNAVFNVLPIFMAGALAGLSDGMSRPVPPPPGGPAPGMRIG
jgi:hypothetical protein